MTEYTFSPEPIPSLSTPSSSTTERNTERTRPRRHTIITRPDSAMALLSDIEDDDQEQQETFDRISGILSSLIQEANEAVNGIEQERVQLLKKKSTSSRKASKTPRVFTSSTIITNHTNEHNSKIPRPRKLRASNTPSISHVRNVSSSSSTSSINTFPLYSHPSQQQLFRHHTVLRPQSCPVIQAPTKRASMTPQHKRNNSNLILVTDPITESFKRLDTSMALVDSLSRDLATPTPTKSRNNNNNSNGLTFLLLVPLLHIPHSLITMIFDFCFTTSASASSGHSNIPNSVHIISRSTTTGSFNLSSMIFWACVFAVTNLMVDQVAVIPKKYLSTITKVKSVRRMSLPGTYHNTNKKKSSKVPPPPVVPLKRTWIPATIQQQYAFRIGNNELLPLPQKRRNSI
ncbi:unnamed protein product [Mucor hiemalis]